ncbi:MAG: spermidine/putrescine ABC transporter permease PotC [Gammaproteobacteria bacterium]|nr:spermidine/putrescine ABC transporter permease PotC [Gammaproteobacteria bacterium]
MTRAVKGGFVSLIFVYLYAPIAVLVVNSFNESKYGYTWKGFSWVWYGKLLNNDALLTAFGHSLTIAVLSATAASIVGTLVALAIYRYRFRFKRSVSGALFVLLVSPDIVLAITFLVLFVAIGVPLGFWTLLLAHTTFCLPFAVIIVYAQLKGIDEYLIEAARDLGASEQRVFWHVFVPLLMPSMAASWLLGFTLSLDDVIISSFVTGPQYDVMPIRVFSMVRVGVSPEVNALATLLLVISIVCLTVLVWLMRRKPAR